MKTNGEFKVDRLQTKAEWQEYAKELESLVLLRPTPEFTPDWTPDEDWTREYLEWWSKIVEFWG